MNELERLKAELERVQKQAAALRGALVRLCNSWAAGSERENYEAMKEAKAAISGDVGRDFISREQVVQFATAFRLAMDTVHMHCPLIATPGSALERMETALRNMDTLGL